MTNLSDHTKGLAAIVAAAMIWGLAPIYYGFLSNVPPADILAHRMLWSLVFFAVILWFRGRLPALRAAVSQKDQVGWTLLAAIMVSFNWFFFIYSIQTGRLTESSLGYYIYPLASVVFGYVFFRERFHPLQWAAVALAAFSVALLTTGLGVVPTISLILATTFSLYGVVKKRVKTGPTVSVTAEVLLLSPFVLVWFAFFAQTADLTPRLWLLLMLSGPLTGLPLILFSQAAQAVRLSTVGLISYLNPTLQFLCAAFVFSEPVTGWHGTSLVLIWVALALYSTMAIRQERARTSTRPSTSGTI
jgi:chloramphenicol-sensitive protein RarD